MNLLFTVLTLLSLPMYAQYGVGLSIDTSGYVNIRSSPKIGNNIIDSIPTETPVFCFEREGNWIPVEFHSKGSFHQGFIYYNRVLQIDSIDYQATSRSINKAVHFNIDSTKIQLSKREVGEKELQIDPSDRTIDGKVFWGTDGNYPYCGYDSLTINSKTYDFKSPELSHYFQPNLGYTRCIKYNNLIYLIANNGDGAGSYTVVWTIKNDSIIDHRTFYGF